MPCKVNFLSSVSIKMRFN